jgi:hypothetical protein
VAEQRHSELVGERDGGVLDVLGYPNAKRWGREDQQEVS